MNSRPDEVVAVAEQAAAGTRDVERLLAVHEIEQALYRYARGVDRRDWELVRSCYHPDGTDDHGRFKGGIDGLVEWLERRHRTGIEQSLHYVQNCSIEFASANIALVESYVIVFQRLGPDATETRAALPEALRPAAGETVDVRFLARCVDRFERRDAAWRIAHRRLVSETVHIEPVPSGAGVGASRTSARRDREDVYYLMRREIFGS